MTKGALSLFHSDLTCGEVIEYWGKKSFRLKLKIIKKIGHTLSIIEKPLVSKN
jgi:hypothetical protein